MGATVGQCGTAESSGGGHMGATVGHIVAADRIGPCTWALAAQPMRVMRVLAVVAAVTTVPVGTTTVIVAMVVRLVQSNCAWAPPPPLAGGHIGATVGQCVAAENGPCSWAQLGKLWPQPG